MALMSCVLCQPKLVASLDEEQSELEFLHTQIAGP